jgi:hypothetical protein
MKLISQALVKFQSQLKPVNKDSENPFFKSSYADLSSILQAVMPLLSANGLALSQPMKVQDGTTILITRLIHESGESIESEMILPHHADPQKFGALISYYKRYQLSALLSVSTCDEDCDANTLVPEKAGNQPYQQQKTTQVYSSPKTSNDNSEIKPAVNLASDAQKNALKRMGIAFESNVSKSEASKLIEQANKR